MSLSGRQWVSKYPEIRKIVSTLDLSKSIASIGDFSSGQGILTSPDTASVNPINRLHLMHYAFRVAREGFDPGKVPVLRGMDIQWLHRDKQGQPDLSSSKNAAEQMVQGFGLFRKPSIDSPNQEQSKPASETTQSAPAQQRSSQNSSTDSAGSQGSELSGRSWVNRFSGSRSIDALTGSFRENIKMFLGALQAARATIIIADTLRPPERAYLMHFSFRIARESLDPAKVPSMPEVGIQWVHRDKNGLPDVVASRDAAEQMVQAFHIVYQPALKSRHTQGLAIDMNITWQGDLKIAAADMNQVVISSTPRDGAGNTTLHEIGASYGVIKLLKDAPHWSSDGR